VQNPELVATGLQRAHKSCSHSRDCRSRSWPCTHGV